MKTPHAGPDRGSVLCFALLAGAVLLGLASRCRGPSTSKRTLTLTHSKHSSTISNPLSPKVG